MPETKDLSKMSVQELLAVIAKQEAEKEALKKAAAEQSSFSIKVGRNGTVSVSGFGRYPLSPYKDQWRALFKLVPSIEQFINEHEAEIDERVATPIAEGAPNPSKSYKLKMAA